MSKQNEHEWLDFKSFQFHKEWMKGHPLTYNYKHELIMNKQYPQSINPELKRILKLSAKSFLSTLENNNLNSSIGVIWGTKNKSMLTIQYETDDLIERMEFIGDFKNWTLTDFKQGNRTKK